MEGDCWTSSVAVFRWPNWRCHSQIHLSFSTWSQIFETASSRPGTRRGKLRSFPNVPRGAWRPVPAGPSQENLWSRMFLRRISWRALANKWQSLSYKWQICSGNRSCPQIAPSSPAPSLSQGTLRGPVGCTPLPPLSLSLLLRPVLWHFPLNPLCKSPVSLSLFPTTEALFFCTQEFISMLSLPMHCLPEASESISLYHQSGECHHKLVVS